MKIRAIEIRNWTCIESLALRDIADGVVVMHGPNQTGKSSLVHALRCCLFDFDHNSSASEILSAIPRRTGETPYVAVEIEIDAQHYRVEKAFAKTKDGFAKLHQQSPAGWNVLAQGKDANAKVREIIGVQKSTSGLFQLMWLEQGEVALPDKLDLQLEKSLEGVLGSMITGRDLAFFAKVTKACERWFTTLMKDSKNSSVSDLQTKLNDALAIRGRIEQDWLAAEKALKEYDEALAQKPDLRRSLDEAEREFDAIAKEREAIAIRRSQHESAAKHHDAEARHVVSAQQQLAEWEKADRKRAKIELELRDAERERDILAERLSVAQAAFAKARETVETEERAAANQQQSRAGIDDRVALLNHVAQAEMLEASLARIREIASRIAEIETKLREFPEVKQAEIDRLRQNREQAITLRAQLQAAEIRIVIEAQQPLAGTITLDADMPIAITLQTDGADQWLIRQKAHLQLGEWANIRIGRVQENLDLEKSARELSELDRIYRDAIRLAGLVADSANAIDHLVARRTDAEAWTKELKKLRDTSNKKAPEGVPAMEAKLCRLHEQAEAVRARRPELREWIANQGEIDELQAKHETAEREAKNRLDEIRESARQADRTVQAEQSAHQKGRDRVIQLAAEFRSATEITARQDHAFLTEAVANASARLAESEKSVRETMLTEEEHSIETRYQAAQNAREQRSRRLRDNEMTLVRLLATLAGTEGLHQNRVQAEQAVNDLQREFDRERLFAESHKHLKTVFEQVRQEQVRRTVGPISDRVMQWTRQLGVADYASLEFGDQLLPGGLNPSNASGMVRFEHESFGTQEQLSILIRLAVGGLLAHGKSMVAILDDPLAHADALKHRRMLDIFTRAAKGEEHGPHPTGPLQLLVLTCHAERFDHLPDAQRIDLAREIKRIV